MNLAIRDTSIQLQCFVFSSSWMFNSSRPSEWCIYALETRSSLVQITAYHLYNEPFIWTNASSLIIRSSDIDNTRFWPPGSLHTLGADGHICQRDCLFMWIKILCIEYILWGIPTIKSTFDVANMVKNATVKDVPINNDVLLNIQAC